MGGTTFWRFFTLLFSTEMNKIENIYNAHQYSSFQCRVQCYSKRTWYRDSFITTSVIRKGPKGRSALNVDFPKNVDSPSTPLFPSSVFLKIFFSRPGYFPFFCLKNITFPFLPSKYSLTYLILVYASKFFSSSFIAFACFYYKSTLEAFWFNHWNKIFILLLSKVLASR